ncbi:MAG: Uncharacterised protein [Cellvibrionales bacterium UBA7375]|nr:MAG: Uncharacterised protein [Cellvibrionales bacterium UBA7375]
MLIEEKTSNQLGMLYGAPWKKDNFLTGLPGKWTHSTIALINDCVVGYLIMSQWQNNIHGHRMAMAEMTGRMRVKVAQALYQQTHKTAINQGIESVTAIVPENNTPTCKFYLNEGFDRLLGVSLQEFINGRKMNAHIESDLLVDNIPVPNEPDRSYVFRLHYKDKQ